MVRTTGVIAALLLAAAAAGAGQEEGWRDKVDPALLQGAEEENVEFLLVLAEQADLGAGRQYRDLEQRRRFVFETLRDLASRSQAPLIAELQSRRLDFRPFWIVNMVWAEGARSDVEELAARADVLRVEANPRVALDLPVPSGPTVPGGSSRLVEWNIAQVRADQVWALGYDGSGVVVGGADTGYDWDHPALIGQYRGWDGGTAVHDHNWHDAIHVSLGECPPSSQAPCDDNNHGTHTMGTMVGGVGTNQIGMAPGAKWIGCRNMNETVGTPATYTECFQWFLAPTDLDGANPDPSLAPDVINNSWACPPDEGCSHDTLRTVVQNTRAAGIVVVASAGNDGSACATVWEPPAIYAAALSVGAAGAGDVIASFSSRGPVTVDGSQRLKPDLTAPGVNIDSSVRGGGYGTLSGTSMAAPHVAGLVALLLSARPDLKGRVDEIEAILERSAWPFVAGVPCGGEIGGEVPNNTYGHGRIDAIDALWGDADDDGSDNLSDCAPVDASVWAAPGPVANLRLDHSTGVTDLVWNPPEEPGALTPLYDLLRSTDAQDFGDAVCVAYDLPLPVTTDSATPSERFFYLVRVKTDCGSTIGTASEGGARGAAACP